MCPGVPNLGIELQNSRIYHRKDLDQCLDGLRRRKLSVATHKQQLAALLHFFDDLVARHAIILNPALSVRSDRYEDVEGKTPEITAAGARKLLASVDTSH